MGEGWGWVAPGAGPGLRGAGRKVAGLSRTQAFHSLSPGKQVRLWMGRRESGGLHLFLCHCSLAGKEMTAGVSRPGAAATSLLHSTCPALGLQASFRPRFSSPMASAMPLSLALCWRLVPLPLHLLSTVSPHSHTPGRLNTEELGNAYVVDTRGREDRRAPSCLGSPSQPLPPSEEGRGGPVPVRVQQSVSLTHLQTFDKAPFGAKAPSQLPTAFSDASAEAAL